VYRPKIVNEILGTALKLVVFRDWNDGNRRWSAEVYAQ